MAVSLNTRGGIAYPFKNSVQGVMGHKTEMESILTSMRNILLTKKGSLPYDPTLGSFVPIMLFEPLNSVNLNLIGYYTKEDLETQEPRISITHVSVELDSLYRVIVKIGFKLRLDQFQQQQGTALIFSRGT